VKGDSPYTHLHQLGASLDYSYEITSAFDLLLLSVPPDFLS